jgi:hypothetical protein
MGRRAARDPKVGNKVVDLVYRVDLDSGGGLPTAAGQGHARLDLAEPTGCRP